MTDEGKGRRTEVHRLDAPRGRDGKQKAVDSGLFLFQFLDTMRVLLGLCHSIMGELLAWFG